MIVRSWLSLTIVVAVALTCCVVAAGSDGNALTSEDLVYPGATVKVEIDVNGEAAVQLVGGLLDAAAEVAAEQAAAIEQATAGAGNGPPVAAIASLIGPARDVIKDIRRVTVLVTRPDESAEPDAIFSHYRDLMTGRGWTPMATVRAERGQRVLVLVAPGGKGVFAMIRPKAEQLVVGLATTARPVGDMLGEIVRAGGGQLPQILMQHAASQKAPEQPAAEEHCESPDKTPPPSQEE